jgi:hypothetical protein
VEKVYLHTATGELAGEAFVVPLAKPAEVILWGQRFFTLARTRGQRERQCQNERLRGDHALSYFEAFCVPAFDRDVTGSRG